MPRDIPYRPSPPSSDSEDEWYGPVQPVGRYNDSYAYGRAPPTAPVKYTASGRAGRGNDSYDDRRYYDGYSRERSRPYDRQYYGGRPPMNRAAAWGYEDDYDDREYRERRKRAAAAREARRKENEFKCHDYHSPIGTEGRHLSINVKLHGINKSQPLEANAVGSWTWPDATGPGGSTAQPLHLCNITAARRWFDAEREHRLDLTCTPGLDKTTDESSSYPIKWLHVQRKKLDFDEFSAIALNTPGLSKDWKVVILSLLKRIRFIARSDGDDHLGPWLLRSDGSELGGRTGDVGIAATSVSFPYFALGPKSGHGPKDTPQQFPIMTLFQWDDRFESAKEWDMEQVFPRMAEGKETKDQIVYVPHVWSIILDKTMITYGPISFEEMHGKSISLLDAKPVTTEPTPKLIRVTDIYDCLFILALNECKTFFEFRNTLESRCLRHSHLAFTDIEILSSDGTGVTPDRWPAIIKSMKDDVINLSLRRKQLSLPAPRPHARRSSAINVSFHEPYSPNGRLPPIRERSPTRERGVRYSSSKGQSRELEWDADARRQNRDASPSSSDSEGSARESPLESQSESGVESVGGASGTDNETSKIETERLAVVVYHKGDQDVSPRARSQRRQQENHLGTPTSVVLARSSRTVQIESGLRHEWESEGVTCDIPLWTSSGRTEFTPDPLSAARERRKLQKQGIIVFDDTPKDTPHLYILPDKKHENGNGNGGSSRGGGARRGSMDSFDSSLYSMSSNSDDDSDTTQTSRRVTSERAATPTGEHTKIEVPPFLSWATSDKQDESGENDEKTETSEYVERILEAIHESLKGQEPESKSKAYKRAREASQESVEKAYPLLLKDSSPESTSSPSVPQEESGASSSASPAQNKPPETNPHLSDPLHLILLKVANGKIRDLYQRFAELVGFYAPQPSGHAMISKCWGTFEMIMSLFHLGVERDAQASKGKEPAFWVIRDISKDPDSESYTKPTRAWGECRTCQSGHMYRSSEEGSHHVRTVHFGSSGHGKEAAPTTGTIDHWLRNDRQYRIDQRLDLYTRYITIALGHMRTVHTKAKAIREGVAVDEDSKSEKYRLPNSLVKALESTIMLMVYTSRAFTIINRYCSHFEQHRDSKEKEMEERDDLSEARDEADEAGCAAVLAMEKAEQDIMLMAHTDVDTGTVSYDAVGPEYILSTVMANLFNRPLYGKDHIDLVYAGFYRKLYTDALKHPRTRVIREIWRMREELGLIRSCNHSQWELLQDFRNVLEPCTFRVTTMTRATRFRAERSFFINQMNMRHDSRIRIDGLDSRLADVSKHVVQMLEMRQENNGNAIIVFTLVTIIFLPLSWATSYLGMNTNDIRNLQQGQWLFWTIAGPLAALVIGAALIVVLKGEIIREFLIKRETGLKDGRWNRSEEKRRMSTILSMKETWMEGAGKTGKQDERRWSNLRRRNEGTKRRKGTKIGEVV